MLYTKRYNDMERPLKVLVYFLRNFKIASPPDWYAQDDT